MRRRDRSINLGMSINVKAIHQLKNSHLFINFVHFFWLFTRLFLNNTKLFSAIHHHIFHIFLVCFLFFSENFSLPISFGFCHMSHPYHLCKLVIVLNNFEKRIQLQFSSPAQIVSDLFHSCNLHSSGILFSLCALCYYI